MKPRRLLLDGAVLLDVLLARGEEGGPESADEAAAARLWARVELGAAQGLVAAHAVVLLHDAARAARGAPFARRLLAQVLHVFGVAPVDSDVVRAALDAEGADFDLALLAAAARASRCHAVVTRRGGGVGEAGVAVLSPLEALAALR